MWFEHIVDMFILILLFCVVREISQEREKNEKQLSELRNKINELAGGSDGRE